MRKILMTAAVLLSVQAQLFAQYDKPIRPGTDGRNPFWNEFATKFMYAPAFDFDEVPGAKEYLFTAEFYGTEMVVSDRYKEGKRSEDPTPHWILGPGAPTGEKWSFKAKSPDADLSKIWSKLPVGRINLTVEALDSKGNVIGKAGERSFMRDFQFEGSSHYPSAVRPYKEAAIMALMCFHEQPAIQSWKTSKEPDMSYGHNTYACKIIGATIRLECLIAKLVPSRAAEADSIARNAAAFLISHSHPDGHVLAAFPPTYYLNKISSSRPENQGKTMMMEPCAAGDAFLDLYDLTGDRQYFDQARKIADTYARLQAEDGSYPIKIDYETGEPVNSCKGMLTPVIEYFLRFERQYGVKDFRDNVTKADAWMKAVALDTFDMTGQFEDMTVLGQKPYQNLTECASAPYASYLLKKEGRTKDELSAAMDLIRFSEDQFVCWDCLPCPDGYRFLSTPCVFEQYGYRVPIDNSSAVVANAFLDEYAVTGNKIAYAKAKALIDNITVVQYAIDGHIPTSWDMRAFAKGHNRGWWTNCTYASVTALLRMADMENR